MPEMPEVQGLVDFLRGRATGLTITRVSVATFAALKTYDPPVDALRRRDHRRRAARQVHRPGDDDRDREFRAAPDLPPREGGLAALVRPAARDDHPPREDPDRAARRAVATARGSTSPRRARRSRSRCTSCTIRAMCPESLGSDPTRSTPTFTRDTLAGLLDGRRTQIKGVLRDQSIIAGVGNAYSDEILHAAQHVAVRAGGEPDARRHRPLFAAMTDDPHRSGGRGIRQAARRAQGRQAPRHAGARPPRRDVPGLRRHGAQRVLRRQLARVLPDVPDRRQDPRRPSPVAPAQVAPNHTSHDSAVTSSSTQSSDFVTAFFHCRTRRSRSSTGIRGSHRLPSRQWLPQAVAVRPDAGREPGRVGGAERGRLDDLRADDGDAEDVGLELHQHVVARLPPSTRSSVELATGVGDDASITSRVWNAAASSAARAMCALFTKRVSPTSAPRASGRQYGANSPEKAGTKYAPPLSSTVAARPRRPRTRS